jgi:hypothetical protein
MRTSLICSLCIVLLLASCAAVPPPQARLGLQLAPGELGEEIALQQHLTIERNGKTDQLDAALEVDANQLQLVGLAFGQRVLSLQYDGKKMTSWRHFMLPEQVRAEDILEDIQLTLWPIEAIRKALPPGWRIEDQGLQRALYMGDDLICEIRYSAMPRWSGTVKLENFRYHYTIYIQSQPNN